MSTSEPDRRGAPYSFVLVLLAVFGFAIFFEIGRMDVFTDNEGQRAAPPAEMIRTGDYIVPTINESVYLAKPPLLYWAIVPVYRLTGGASEWAARIPSASCALLLIVLVYVVLRRAAGEMNARWAAIITGAAPYVLERARWTELDVPLTLAMFAAVAALYLSKNDFRAIAIGGIAGGAAVLLKGPVVFPFLWAGWVAAVVTRAPLPGRALVLTGVALAADFLFRGFAALIEREGVLTFPWGLLLLLGTWTWYAVCMDWRGERLFVRWLGAAAVSVLLAAPWAVAVVREVGWAYIQSLLDEQVVERTYTASSINSGSTFYFFLGAPAMLAPWGLVAPALLSPSLWHRYGAWYRFAVLYGAVGISAFSLFAGKEYEYILPVIPFLASGLAFVWLEPGDYGRWRWLNAWTRAVKAACPSILWTLLITGAVYVSVLYALPVLIAEIWLFVAVAALAGRRFRGYRSPIRVAAPALAAILLVLVTRSHHYNGENSPKTLVRQAAAIQRAGYTVETSKIYPAFAFYAGQRIEEEQDIDAVRAKLSGDDPYYYLTRAGIVPAFLAEVPEDKRVVVAGPVTSKEFVLITNRAPAE